MNDVELKQFANNIRKKIMEMMLYKGGGHVGGSLSIVDLLAVLYGRVMRYYQGNLDWEERDYLICSKGHAGPAIYATLALLNFFPMDWTKELNIGGTHLPGHCDRLKVPGIEATTGSLGQGLSIATGLAQGLKVHNKSQYVYCIVGDGESEEGQIWEAAMYASHYKLSNLIAFTDWNKKQIDGLNEKVMNIGDLSEKYRSFGWNSFIIDGADVNSIYAAIQKAKIEKNQKPTMIVLDTVKGAGISCIELMENNHCIRVSQELFEECKRELDMKLEE